MGREPKRRRRRLIIVRRLWWSCVAIVIGVGLLPGATPGHASAAGGQEVEVAATAGLGGRVGMARAYPVTVDVTARQLLSGTLRVRSQTDFGPDVVQRAIEVAAGTTKRFVVTMGSSNGFGGEEVGVDVVTAEGTVASDRVRVAAEATDELVGVLPGLAATLDREVVPVVSGLGQARLGPVAPEILAAGALALEVYDQIAAGPGDLEAFSDADVRSLVQWVGLGGYLLVDGSDALPDALDPSPGRARVVGLGRVVLTDGALTAGRWSSVILPTPIPAQNEEAILGSQHLLPGDVALALADEAGFDMPSLRTLLAMLFAYVVVVGPVAWLAVRRRHTTLLWVVIPAIALVTTGLLQVAGDDFHDARGSVHVTMIETAGGEAMATATVLVADQSAATAVDFPIGWRPAINPFFSGFGFFGGGSLPVVEMQGDGSRVTVEPGVGGAAVVRARGPVDLDGSLIVTATSDRDGVMGGTIENTLSVPLEDVAVFVGRAGVVEIGDLAAGATEEWEVDDTASLADGAVPELSVWPLDFDPEKFGMGDGMLFNPMTGEPIPGAAVIDEVDRRSAAASLSGFADVAADREGTFKPQGQAVAVGWTRDLDAPLRVDGDVVSRGRTGIVARAVAVSTGSRLVDTGAVLRLVRGPAGAGLMAGPFPENKILGVYAFELPGEVDGRPVDPARLTLRTPAQFSRVQTWTRGKWRDLPTPEGEARLPAGSVVSGSVLIRIEVPRDPFMQDSDKFLLYEAKT